jgi:hypothetical protein
MGHTPSKQAVANTVPSQFWESLHLWALPIKFQIMAIENPKIHFSFFNFSFFLAKFCQGKKKDCNLSLHKISLKSRDEYFIIFIIKNFYKKM